MMKHYEALGENLFLDKLPNGLTVAVVPRPGFQRKLAYFVTDFGAQHTEFTLDGVHYQMPAGVAHFLEHKMFELPDRDVMEEFAALGANVNAFTGYDVTAYYFSCTENFFDSLRLLLEFVSVPYFEEESVCREQGIIDQEIGMNLDSPDSRVFENLMEQMYSAHPIRVPILGTSETIRQITPEILHICHRAFYTPDNMILCVVGDVDPGQVCRVAREVLGDALRPAGEKRTIWQEDMTVLGDKAVQMEVAMPQFQLAFKCEPLDKGEQAIRREIVGDLAAEALFGESSALYLQLYDQGLIDSSFGGGFETVEGCAFLSCGGDSVDAAAVREAIIRQAERIGREGIPETDFLRMKRSALGRRIRDLDSFDSTCFRICAYYLSEYDYFDFPKLYAAVTAEEIQEFLWQTVQENRCAMSVVEPLCKQ